MKKIIQFLVIIMVSTLSINAQEIIMTSSCGSHTTYKLSTNEDKTDCFKPQEFAQPMRVTPDKSTSIRVDVEEKQNKPREKTVYTQDNTWKDKSTKCSECDEPTTQKITEHRNSTWDKKSKIIQYTPSCFIEG